MVMAVPRYERDLYAVLGLGCYCSPEDIRTAYKKLALQCHPDKLLHTGISKEAATAQFQELLRAYEVLSDPQKRSSYDYQQEVLFWAPKTETETETSAAAAAAEAKKKTKPPAAKCSGPDPTANDLCAFMSKTAFCGYSDTGKGFYKVYSDLFKKVFAGEVRHAMKTTGQRVPGAPVLGNRNSPEKHVMAFYSYWLRFGKVEESSRCDSEEEEKKKKKKKKRARQKARKEYYEVVRVLADFVMKRDIRVIDIEKTMGKNKFRDGIWGRGSVYAWI